MTFLEALTDQIPLHAAAIIFAAVAIAGFMRGFLGFGGAVVIIMTLNALLGAHYAVPVACLAGLPATVQLLPSAVRHSDRSFVLPFAVASMLAIPIGTVVLVVLDPGLMKVVVSALVLVVVALLYCGWRAATRPTTSAIFGAGVGAGLIQGVAGVGGPPTVAMSLAQPGDAETQRANVIGAITALSVGPVVPLWYFGLFTKQVVLLSLAIVPLYMLSTFIGARYFSGNGREHYRNGALIALGLMGCVTLVVSIRDYLAGA
ncbi:MAG: TSUP family transporter [Hyphomicrobiaceae bacterium]